jgi:hypothetical protein
MRCFRGCDGAANPHSHPAVHAKHHWVPATALPRPGLCLLRRLPANRLHGFICSPSSAGWYGDLFSVSFCHYKPEFILWWTLCIGLDGYAARRLGQVSEFGAWVRLHCRFFFFTLLNSRIPHQHMKLDIFIDNIGRTLLWCYVMPVSIEAFGAPFAKQHDFSCCCVRGLGRWWGVWSGPRSWCFTQAVRTGRPTLHRPRNTSRTSWPTVRVLG